MKLDWLIIGGGIHGVHIAARLLGDASVPTERLRIVDPGERLLAQWRNCTAAVGMTHLRSSSVHHLGLHHGALQRFAGKYKRRKPGLFAPPFQRPSLSLFNAHCDHVEQTYGLADLHIRNRAVKCSIRNDGVEVRLDDERELQARNLVLAIGASEQPRWPDWAPRSNPHVHHVFEPECDGWPSRPQTVMVVGGGISAAHVVLRLLKEGHQVHLVSRHGLRQHQFDSDPGWLGWKYKTIFSRQRDPEQRRTVVTEARNRGSVPPDVARSLRRAIARGKLQWHEGEVQELITRTDGIRARIDTDTVVPVDRVLLATGFASRRPGGAMVDELIDSASLPCACCGYPIVDSELRWHPRIYVSGPLAELELGPVSRNIAGARRAGDRIVDAIRPKSAVRT
ncbi:MAG: hypothetical protein CMJ24_04255 [Phycisphaerae bacterium]|nr:hypothetical protein [Phycisphaerae bacterium]MDG1898453.1 FAD/NAD(P)-binding protein [Phycisphaerales bacterium]